MSCLARNGIFESADKGVGSDYSVLRFACVAGISQIIDASILGATACDVLVSSSACIGTVALLGVICDSGITAIVEAVFLTIALGLSSVSVGTKFIEQEQSAREGMDYRRTLRQLCDILTSVIQNHPACLVSSNSGQAITTRFERLIQQIVSLRVTIVKEVPDDEVGIVMKQFLGYLTRELRIAINSTEIIPSQEVADACPTMLDYASKTLNRETHYAASQSGAAGVAKPSTIWGRRGVLHDASSSLDALPQINQDGGFSASAAAAGTERFDGAGKATRFDGDQAAWAKPGQARIGRRVKRSQTMSTAKVRFDELAEEQQSIPTVKYLTMPTIRAATNISTVAQEEISTVEESVEVIASFLTFCESPIELRPPHPNPSCQTREMLESGLGTWKLDMFEIAKRSQNRPLLVTGGYALRPSLSYLNIEERVVTSFLDELESRYQSSNPYHNSTHGADVGNNMLYFLNLPSTPFLEMPADERFAALIAAYSHDVGHNGRANSFHLGAGTPLAMLYNDQSVLENMHCAIAFLVMSAKASNVLVSLEAKSRATLRATIVEMILDTDLANHMKTLSRFRQEFICDVFEDRAGNFEEVTLEPAQRRMLLTFALKASDVAGSSKPFDVHVRWAMRIMTEFFEQGNEERKMGLPVSPFCDDQQKQVCESQVGFFEFIVSPLYRAISDYLDSCNLEKDVLPYTARNAKFWKQHDGNGFDYANPRSNEAKLVASYDLWCLG